MDICDYKTAKELIKKSCSDELRASISLEALSNLFSEENNLKMIKDIVHHKLNDVYQQITISVDDINAMWNIGVALECVAANNLHSKLMPIIQKQFKEDDDYLFEKCKILCHMNITAEQLGGNQSYAVPLSAAVVELATLDNRRSVVEKMNCLYCTYDYVFAELKSALINSISKYSENEAEIPIIDNSDILPVLMVVIIRSKLLHLMSNLFYIEEFQWKLKENKESVRILDIFKKAADHLLSLTETSLQPGSEDVCRELDLIKIIDITDPANQNNGEGNRILREQRRRLTDLIMSATNEHNKSQ